MTILHIPPLIDGAGDLLPAVVNIRLVDAFGNPVIAVGIADLVTEYQSLSMPSRETDGGLSVELTPQADIALPDGGATHYQIEIVAGVNRRVTYTVDITDSVAPLELIDIIIPPAE